MAFNPKAEPCFTCGREPEECICGFAPEFPDDYSMPELDTAPLDWDIYPDEEDDAPADEEEKD